MKRNHISLTKNEKKALGVIKRDVSAEFIIDTYMLFGSKVRGDYDDESDVDLLIVTKRMVSGAQRWRISEIVFEANMEYDTSITAVVVAKEEWESELWSILPFRVNVSREGVNI